MNMSRTSSRPGSRAASRAGSRMNMTGASMISQDSAARARFMAHVHQRSTPPRISPALIIVVVLSLGMLFIGLTMTIIANWPGYSTIGENPLEIIGPILLAIGGVAFITAVSIACVRTTQHRERMQKTYHDILTGSQSSLGGGHLTPGRSLEFVAREELGSFATTVSNPSLDAQPGRSILKTPRATDTEESDSGLANSVDQNNRSGVHFPVYKISTQPDPTKNARDKKRHRRTDYDPSSTDSEQSIIPDPVRIKARDQHNMNQQSGSSTSYSNDAYTADDTEPDVYAMSDASSHRGSSHHVTIQEAPGVRESARRRRRRRQGHHSGGSGRRHGGQHRSHHHGHHHGHHGYHGHHRPRSGSEGHAERATKPRSYSKGSDVAVEMTPSLPTYPVVATKPPLPTANPQPSREITMAPELLPTYNVPPDVLPSSDEEEAEASITELKTVVKVNTSDQNNDVFCQPEDTSPAAQPPPIPNYPQHYSGVNPSSIETEI